MPNINDGFFYLLFFLLFLSLSLFTHYRVFVRNVSNVIIKSRNSESISVNRAYTLIHALTRMHEHQPTYTAPTFQWERNLRSFTLTNYTC